MARTKLINKLDHSQPIYVGLDVHSTKWSVCIIHQDEVIENHTIPGKYESLKALLLKYQLFNVYSAYEAGFLGFYLHRHLQNDNINNIVVSPNKIPVESGNFIKTDKRDAKKIAFSLSKGLLEGIHVPTEEQEDLRQILRTREKIVRSKRTIINRIKMTLYRYEVKVSKIGLSKKSIEEIRALELPEHIKFSIDLYLEQLELLIKQSNLLQSRAHSIAQKSTYANTYTIINTIPGIGPVIASVLCFEIGNFSRFSNGKKLAAYIGITPREFSSGEHVYKGRITGQGNGMLRSYLIEACWFLIGKDPAMKEYYNRIKSNSGSGKKAIVAVGRKLINRIHSIVSNNKSYAIGEIG